MNPEAVSTILREGYIVRTKLGGSNIWNDNIVYKAKDDVITISLTDYFLQNVLMEGSNICLKYSCEYFEYIFDGKVSSIKPGYPGYVTIDINKTEERINTRAFPRYDAYLAAEVRPTWSETWDFCVVTIISLGGMAFTSQCHYDCGEETDVAIYLPSCAIARGKGKVIRKNANGANTNYSMQFIEMDKNNTSLISHYNLSIDNIWKSMQADFFNNIKHKL